MIACNGGGILPAMICGRLAGLAAANHLLHKTPLSAYEREWRSQIGKELVTTQKIKRIADCFFSSDSLLEIVMRLMGIKGLGFVIGGLRKT